MSDTLQIVSDPGRPSDGALTRKQVWELFLVWSDNDKQRMAYRNQTRLYAAVRAKMPNGEAVNAGTRFFPNLRVRTNG